MTIKVSGRLLQTDVKSLLPDGCAIFHRVHWPSSGQICFKTYLNDRLDKEI